MASEPQTPAQTIDYNFAREELMLNELSNDPIQAAIARLEKQHEEDKQGTLQSYLIWRSGWWGYVTCEQWGSVRICVLWHVGRGGATYVHLNGKLLLLDIEVIYPQYSGHPLWYATVKLLILLPLLCI